MFEIYCLMVSGLPLSSSLRTSLVRTARVMLKKGEHLEKISSHDGEGAVYTEFKSSCLGCIAGTVFTAEVETDHGKTKVKFLVRSIEVSDEALEEAFWIGYDSRESQKAQWN